MSLNKLRIEILDSKAVDDQRLPGAFYVQFNPTEYTLSKSASYSGDTGPDRDSPKLSYTGGQSGTLSIELMFDTTREGGMAKGAKDVRTGTSLQYVRELVRIQPKTHAPPRVRLIWGQGLTFRGYADSVQEKFTLFAPDGTPVRATATVGFKEALSKEEHNARFNLQSPDHTRTRVVQQGETLCGIAAEEFLDARVWRHIADANSDVIGNPRVLEPGTVLVLPPLTGGGAR